MNIIYIFKTSQNLIFISTVQGTCTTCSFDLIKLHLISCSNCKLCMLRVRCNKSGRLFGNLGQYILHIILSNFQETVRVGASQYLLKNNECSHMSELHVAETENDS